MNPEEKVKKALELLAEYNKSSSIELRGDIFGLLIEAMNEGNARAPGILADFYYYDMNIADIDHKKAEEYYRIGADRGDGYCLYHFYLSERFAGNYLKSFDYLKRSAESESYPYSMLVYGENLLHLNISTALEWMKKSAEAGYSPAYLTLATIKRYGPYVQDRKEAFEYLKLAVSHEGFSSLAGYYLMGNFYDFGIGTKVNHKFARKYYKLSIKNKADPVDSLGMIGRHYLHGLGGLNKNIEKGISMLLKASENANTPEIYLELSNCYQNGVGVKKNDRLAKKYALLAKEAEEKYYQEFVARMEHL